LFVAAAALLRGKRHAWLLSCTLVPFSMASAFASRGHRSYPLFAVALLATLLALAPLFPAKSDPGRLRRGYLAVGLCLLCLIGHSLLAAIWHQEVAHGIAQEVARAAPSLHASWRLRAALLFA